MKPFVCKYCGGSTGFLTSQKILHIEIFDNEHECEHVEGKDLAKKLYQCRDCGIKLSYEKDIKI